MKRHRLMAAVLALIIAAALCSCGSKQNSGGPEQTPGTESADSEAAQGDVPAISGLRTLVTRADRDDYDFTEKALAYLSLIGENYPDRSIPDDEGQSRHDAFGDWLLSELEFCGYDPGPITEQPFSGESFPGKPLQGRNIILTVPGKTEGKQIIVGAHYDGDGVGDNGSGVALLLAAAAGLADISPELTIRYIFFDGEEEGLLGSRYYAGNMSEEEISSTLYMINADALAFGDFCCIYGGVYGDDYDAEYISLVEGEPLPDPEHTEGYAFAADTAEALGFRVYRTADLDGYYEEHGKGMEPEDAFFTNPWTNGHPAPENMLAPSPATFGASDQTGFAVLGIPYIYFEATNWWAEGKDPYSAYTGYVETYDTDLGDGGQFMNTDYDTLEVLHQLFPDRAEEHYRLFSPLLSALLLLEAV